MCNTYFAHSAPGKDISDWQPLEEHLINVAQKAAEFAKSFGGEKWAYLAGLCHDWGKGSKSFQAYLRKLNNIEDQFIQYHKGRVDHSSFGAQWSYKRSKQAGKLIAYCLAGHHSGLLNWVSDKEHGLSYRLRKSVESVNITLPDQPDIPKNLPIAHLDQKRFGFQLQFFMRMIFSCLVDADFLDTEQFLEPEKARHRNSYPALKEIEECFWQNFNKLRENAARTEVNEVRENILSDCLDAASRPPGLFSLTVPTGGGKTLSSMAFALKHAIKYGKRRIIYVIPFTSIIEQNAQVLREMISAECVLEHHSNFIPDNSDWKTKLATENWDAPVIVTTNVQFFDCFFSNKTSKCRRLHNVVNSVIIFDEVQAIPVERILPCIEVLRELVDNYGVSVVLCTATQPAVEKSEEFGYGLPITREREIIKDVSSLYQKLKRTREKYMGICSTEELAEKIKSYKQVLCIASTRRQALEIFNSIKDKGDAFHLSALMYPAHRSRKLKKIKERLAAGQHMSCRVVSTQVIEAGVDVDFPVVYRSLAGLDSIAQAAGRCNREGKMDHGYVFIFKPDKEIPPGYFRQTAQCAERLLDRFGDRCLELTCIHDYFKDYYWANKHRMDEGHILDICKAAQHGEIQFEDIANFRMIKDASEPIVVAIEEDAIELVEKLKYVDYPGPILRKLQRYSVQIYPYHLASIKDWLIEPFPGLYVLMSNELYSDDTGLLMEATGDEIYIL